MKEIKSRNNQEIKKIADLHKKKYRTKYGFFLAEGSRVCKTLLASGTKLEQFYVTEKNVQTAQSMADAQMITLVPDMVMEKLSSATSPSGIVGVFQIPKQTQDITPGIVLAQLSDPGNVGTLIRTAAAMNIKTVVCVDTVDPWSPKVIQGSAGTIGNVHILNLSWDQLLQQKKDLPLYALVVSGGKKPSEIENKKSLLVIGSEAHGIPNEWFSSCDEKMTIEMPGNTESLNAAVAGSIAAYLMFK